MHLPSIYFAAGLGQLASYLFVSTKRIAQKATASFWLLSLPLSKNTMPRTTPYSRPAKFHSRVGRLSPRTYIVSLPRKHTGTKRGWTKTMEKGRPRPFIKLTRQVASFSLVLLQPLAAPDERVSKAQFLPETVVRNST